MQNKIRLAQEQKVPYMVVLGTLPQVTHHVTGLVEAGDLRALRLLAGRLAVLGAAVVVLGAVIGGTAGPALVRAVFGDTVDIGHGDAGLIATGCALALVNVVLMVAALALDRPGRVAGAWGLAVLAGAMVLLPTTWLLRSECCCWSAPMAKATRRTTPRCLRAG